MVIRDKQELKRCVKQSVRRAQVVETALCFDVMNGEMGVSRLLETWAAPAGAPNDALRRACAQETPFCADASSMFAALSALELPTHNLGNAQTIAQSYDRAAYLREVLDAMRAERVLFEVSPEQVDLLALDDDRFAPVLSIDAKQYLTPGRYGIAYEAAAQRLSHLLCASRARDIRTKNADIDAIRYCLIPLSEDDGCVLHLYADDKDHILTYIRLLQEHPDVRAVISCDSTDERMLIDCARNVPNMLVQLDSFAHMRYALEMLGTRFVPFSSGAVLPEQMLGRWVNARENIWPILLEAYLPLARSGYELTSEAIQRDVAHLFGANLNALYRN